MSSNPTLSLFLGWNEMHGGSMGRHSSSETGQRGEADRRSRVLQLARWMYDFKLLACVRFPLYEFGDEKTINHMLTL